MLAFELPFFRKRTPTPMLSLKFVKFTEHHFYFRRRLLGDCFGFPANILIGVRTIAREENAPRLALWLGLGLGLFLGLGAISLCGNCPRTILDVSIALAAINQLNNS